MTSPTRARTPSYRLHLLILERDAFISGNTSARIFHIESGEEKIAYDEAGAYRFIPLLEEKQTPNLLFCVGPLKMSGEEERIKLLLYE